jgi:hypothetical protein
LSDPRNNQIRYVGKSNKPISRLLGHLNDINNSNTYKNNWIKSLLKQNLKPILEIIDEVDIFDWIFWEKYWISQFKAWGFKLTNLTEGGDGFKGQHSELTKQKMSKTRKGVKRKPFSEEWKKNISLSHIGKPLSKEKREKIKNIIQKQRCGKRYDEIYGEEKSLEIRKKQSGKNILKSHIPWNKGLKYSEERKKEISLIMKKVLSEINIREKIRQSVLKTLEKKKAQNILPYNCKKVEQLDKDGNFLKLFMSCNEAEFELKGKGGDMIACCARGKQKTAYGYKWRFVI